MNCGRGPRVPAAAGEHERGDETSTAMPHGYIVAIDPPRDDPPRRWMCKHCQQVATLPTLRAIDCTASRPATDDELIDAVEGKDAK